MSKDSDNKSSKNKRVKVDKPAVLINVAYPNNIHPTSRQHVMKGRGITTSTAAIPQQKGKNQPNKVWKVLFDSRSDGDILHSLENQKKHLLTCIPDFICKGRRPVMVFSGPLKLVTC